MKALQRDLHPETREGPGAALVLSTQKSIRHDWQAVWKDPACQDFLRSKWVLASGRWAVWVQTQTQLQLARLVERVSRNFGEKRLTGVVFLDVVMACDTVWVDGLIYKLTILNTLCTLSQPFLPTCMAGCSKRFSNQPHPLVVACGMAWLRVEIISPVLFSLFVNDMPMPSHYVELVLYADDTANIAKSHNQRCFSATRRHNSAT